MPPSDLAAQLAPLLARKRHGEAIKLLQARLESAPENLQALNLLAVCLHESGQTQAALAACQRSLQLDERQIIPLRNAARLLLHLDLPEVALDYTRQALHLYPDDQEALVMHAKLLLKQEHWAEFVHYQTQCWQRWPADAQVQRMQFFRLMREEQWQAAMQLAQEHPSTILLNDNLINYGNVLHQIEGSAAAKKCYERGIRHWMKKLPRTLAAPGAGTASRYMDVGKARQALLALKQALDSLQIPFFLAFGTFLGIARDGELLPHDKDMDVGLPWSTPRLALIEALLTLGFICPQIESYRQNPPGSYATVIHLASRITIDFFFARPLTLADGRRVVDMGFAKGEHSSLYWRFSPFAMGGIDYAGERFLAPADAATHLAEVYGADWRVPDANFDSCLRGHNLTPESRPTGIAMGYNRLLGHLSKGNWKKAHGYCGQIIGEEHSPLIARLQTRLSALLESAA